MSDETDAEDDFQNALAAFVTNRYGSGMLTSYYIVGEFIDEDGDVCWITKAPAHQSLTSTVGLIEWARLDINLQSENYLKKLYEEEDE